MLTRYKVLESFTLTDSVLNTEEPFVAGSTFMNENETIGEALRKAGFLQVVPRLKPMVDVEEIRPKKLLTTMNKGELIEIAERENIAIDTTQTKRIVLAQIRRERALRGEDSL